MPPWFWTALAGALALVAGFVASLFGAPFWPVASSVLLGSVWNVARYAERNGDLAESSYRKGFESGRHFRPTVGAVPPSA